MRLGQTISHMLVLLKFISRLSLNLCRDFMKVICLFWGNFMFICSELILKLPNFTLGLLQFHLEVISLMIIYWRLTLGPGLLLFERRRGLFFAFFCPHLHYFFMVIGLICPIYLRQGLKSFSIVFYSL